MTIYDVSFAVFSLIYLPYMLFKRRAWEGFTQRFGNLPEEVKRASSSGPIWIHAVSVGEVFAAKDFVKDLSKKHPERKIIFSTTTKTGNAIAKKVLGEDIPKFYFPLDFSFIVRKVVGLIKPSVFIVMETEIWPNLILELSRRKIPVCLINGRISDKSFAGYRKIKFLFGGILKKIDLFCMQSDSDASRIEAIGAAKENIRVTGNVKYDVEDANGREFKDANCREFLCGGGKDLFIAGSTHPGEEEIILDVYKKLSKKFANLRLLIAPRHVDRAKDIRKLVKERGFDEKQVYVLDVMGELAQLYGTAKVVFLGGSLVKRGGHNIVEPALFGKPVLFGPHMFNFRAMADEFLEHKAAVQVRDGEELSEKLEELLSEKSEKSLVGEAARKIIEKNKGAVERNVKEVGLVISRKL